MMTLAPCKFRVIGRTSSWTARTLLFALRKSDMKFCSPLAWDAIFILDYRERSAVMWAALWSVIVCQGQIGGNGYQSSKQTQSGVQPTKPHRGCRSWELPAIFECWPSVRSRGKSGYCEAFVFWILRWRAFPLIHDWIFEHFEKDERKIFYMNEVLTHSLMSWVSKSDCHLF